MENTLAVVVLLIVALFLIFGINKRKEGFFGFSGWDGYLDGVEINKVYDEVDMNSYRRNTDASIPKEAWGKLIESTQQEISKALNICLEPFTTIWAHIYDGPGGRLYKYRVMYVAVNEQIGVEIQTTASIDPDGKVNIIAVETDEPIKATDPIKAYYPDEYKDYLQYNNIVMKNAPTKEAIDLVEKSISKKFA